MSTNLQRFDPHLSATIPSFPPFLRELFTSFCMQIHVPAITQRLWACHFLALLPFERMGQRWSAGVMRKHFHSSNLLIKSRSEFLRANERGRVKHSAFNKADSCVKEQCRKCYSGLFDTLVSRRSSLRCSHGLVADRNAVGREHR